MTLHRRKKFVRSKESLERIVIQPRDLAIITDIADYRFLDTEQILALHPGSLRNTQVRLSLLFHHGFVNRPPSQNLFAHSGHMIYSIGNKGAKLLSRKHLKGEVAFPYLAHAMMISRFHVIVSLALQKHTDKPELARWVQGYALKELLSSSGEKTNLIPDAFFSVEHNGDMLHFFLEADRGTMTRERVFNKMKIYWRWWREKACEKNLDITRFRVLTIAPSEIRSENLCRDAKNADTRKEGSNMFLFAPETAFSLNNPEVVLSPVWHSPKDTTKHHILE